MVFFTVLIRWVRGLFRHEKRKLLVLGLLGISVSGLWHHFSAPPHPSPDDVIVANFKRRVCSLHWSLYHEEKWHRSLYQVLDVHARAGEVHIIKAYQKKIIEADNGTDTNVNTPIDQEGSSGASWDISSLPSPDRRMLNLNSALLILIKDAERDLYHLEFYDKVGFIYSDREKRGTSKKQGELEREYMRKVQADIDERLRDVCKDYSQPALRVSGWDTRCKGA
ncbi:hypothetical protein QQZ08_010078 [Neonectria magnoliae]|uniref:Uncharacterized protein n=1 Tax=Neonectria magnoliae TaxID=2732573 RepID=A0ABR1HIX6_9HYPO